MSLRINNPEVERLITEVAVAMGVSKTEAIRQAMLERKARLGMISIQESVNQINRPKAR